MILAFSILLRVFLALQGGQFIWPDERRYYISQMAIESLMSGKFLNFGKNISGKRPDKPHLWASPGIILAGLIPACIEYAIGKHPVIPAFFFGLFSVLNIFLVFRILQHAGSDKSEALLASFFLSISNSIFYYARSILTYDVSMTFCLLAILSGIAKPEQKKNAFLCGIYAALGFLIYNGYWTFSACALLIPFIYRQITFNNLIKHTMYTGFGFLLPFLITFCVATVVHVDIIKSFLLFSQTVNSGVMSEGWSLPFEYYWHTEHFLFLFWLIALFCFLVTLRKNIYRKKVLFALFGIFFIYGNLAFFSVVLHKFVVYARTARQLTPFFCILSAFTVNNMLKVSASKKYAKIILILALIQGCYNFYNPLTLTFSKDFKAQAKALVPQNRQYSILYVEAGGLYPEIKDLPSLPPYEVILQKRGPQNFYPWCFEGFGPSVRKKTMTTDLSMRLIIYKEPTFPPPPIYLP